MRSVRLADLHQATAANRSGQRQRIDIQARYYARWHLFWFDVSFFEWRTWVGFSPKGLLLLALLPGMVAGIMVLLGVGLLPALVIGGGIYGAELVLAFTVNVTRRASVRAWDAPINVLDASESRRQSTS